MPQPARAARALVLFDIDGTLIRRAGPHHRQALVDAVFAVTGLETTLDNVDTSGMLDRDLIRVMMRNAGATEALAARHMDAIARKAQKLYPRSCPVLRHAVCPGVRPALGRLRRHGLPIGLVTGNLSSIAWCKMNRAGIRNYFSFGAFAEMGATRADLVRLAIAQAYASHSIADDARVTLIGDHPNDIDAAQQNGARSIAVATGVIPATSLKACSPDYLLRDLSELKLEMVLR